MPLFMDIHIMDKATINMANKNPFADKVMQEKHGIKVLQYWINEKEGLVFVLWESPDQRSIEAYLVEKYGIKPVQITQVEPGFLKLFLEEGFPPGEYQKPGIYPVEYNPNLRTLLIVNVCPGKGYLKAPYSKRRPCLPKNIILDNIIKYGGQFPEYLTEDIGKGIFEDPVRAIYCAVSIQFDLKQSGSIPENEKKGDHFNKICLYQTKTEGSDSGNFENTLQFATRLCCLGKPDRITITSGLKNIYELVARNSDYVKQHDLFHFFTKSDEEFLSGLLDIIDENLANPVFNVHHLAELMAMSRPQIYRKITALTGKTPNELIRCIRLNKALAMIQSNSENISQIAMEVGYGNPSYFAKVFHENFGFAPSSFMATQKNEI